MPKRRTSKVLKAAQDEYGDEPPLMQVNVKPPKTVVKLDELDDDVLPSRKPCRVPDSKATTEEDSSDECKIIEEVPKVQNSIFKNICIVS